MRSKEPGVDRGRGRRGDCSRCASRRRRGPLPPDACGPPALRECPACAVDRREWRLTPDVPPPRSRASRSPASPRSIRRSSPTTASTSTLLPGEIHAVLGENGAGKSTLMKIIYGVVKPDAGHDPLGRRAGRASPTRRARGKLGIGMVFQHFSLFETLTVAENIALALEGDRARRRSCRERIRDVSATLRAAARSRAATCTRCRSASASASRSSAACCRIRAC